MAKIDPLRLKALLEDEPGIVREALAKVHDGESFQTRLEDIFIMDRANAKEQALIDYVTRFKKVRIFLAAIAERGGAIERLDPTGTERLEQIRGKGVDPAGLEAFASRAAAFRCRIKVNNEIRGSGVLISYRLVLTAWHVVGRRPDWDPVVPPRIEIKSSDGNWLRAHMTKHLSKCHDDEWDGLEVSCEDAAGLDDYAVLRLSVPAGFALGHVELASPLPQPLDEAPCFLVHYPMGEDVGFSLGETRLGSQPCRLRHSALTDQGSSGGALFNNQFELLGIHQKRLNDGQIAVPIINIANDNKPEILEFIASDLKPTYLWSLDQTLGSHVVIGRQTFFDALDHMVQPGTPASERLRGIWMRRERADKDQSGLGFAFELLKAFLARRQSDARLIRIALRSGEHDLFALFEAAIDQAQGASVAQAGVRADETTRVAFEADRADALVRRIEQVLTGPIWLYIDGPKNELSSRALQQLEQLVSRAMRSRRIRFILTRMETHHLPLNRFETLDEIELSDAPGVISDFTGDYTEEDVRTTVLAASDDLSLGLQPIQVDDVVKRALGAAQAMHGRYPAATLKQTAERLVRELRERQAEQ